jgi:hypothetical protein
VPEERTSAAVGWSMHAQVAAARSREGRKSEGFVQDEGTEHGTRTSETLFVTAPRFADLGIFIRGAPR